MCGYLNQASSTATPGGGETNVLEAASLLLSAKLACKGFREERGSSAARGLKFAGCALRIVSRMGTVGGFDEGGGFWRGVGWGDYRGSGKADSTQRLNSP